MSDKRKPDQVLKDKRFLLLTSTIDGRGGAEQAFYREASLLQKNGFTVCSYVICEQPIDLPNGRVFIAPKDRFLRKVRKYTFYPGLYLELRWYLKLLKPDIIHMHTNDMYPLTVLAALRGYNVVNTLHVPSLICPTGHSAIPKRWTFCGVKAGIRCYLSRCVPLRNLPLILWLQSVRKIISKRVVRCHVAPSNWLCEELKRHGYQNAIQVPNFVLSSSQAPREAWHTEPEEKGKVVVFAGLLAEKKGVHCLIKAMVEVVRAVPDAVLKIAGPKDREGYTSAKKLVGELSLNEVVDFLGWLSQSQLSQLLSRACVVVVPSLWWENSPLVVYESMAVGCPVIGSNRGGIPELIQDGVTGFVVDPLDINELAQRTITILSNPDLAAEFGRRARSKAEREYSPESHLAKLLQCYEQNLY